VLGAQLRRSSPASSSHAYTALLPVSPWGDPPKGESSTSTPFIQIVWVMVTLSWTSNSPSWLTPSVVYVPSPWPRRRLRRV